MRLTKLNKLSGEIERLGLPQHPSCFISNKGVYPLCKGARNSQDFALNDCRNCGLYEDLEKYHNVYYQDDL